MANRREGACRTRLRGAVGLAGRLSGVVAIFAVVTLGSCRGKPHEAAEAAGGGPPPAVAQRATDAGPPASDTAEPLADAGATMAEAAAPAAGPPNAVDGPASTGDAGGDAAAAADLVSLFGGRLRARLPAGRADPLGPALPGKILTCTEYTARLAEGDVTITGLELGALAGRDMQAEVARELVLMAASAPQRTAEWTLAPVPSVRPPLRAVRAVRDADSAYLCGPTAVDVLLRNHSRLFVALADDSVVILDFSYDAESGVTAEAVGDFVRAVEESLEPGPVVLVREAGTRVLPDIPPGEDLEFEAAADMVVSASWGTDSLTIIAARLRPLGETVAPDLVGWSHSCEPGFGEEGGGAAGAGRRRTRGTLAGLPVESERGRKEDRWYEAIVLKGSVECVDLTLWADSEERLGELRAALDAGRRVVACTADRECGGRACVERRCVEGGAVGASP